MKSDDLLKQTLRLTAYKIDSVTRIRHIVGHMFIKFDQFLDENQNTKSFSTNILTECLIPDLHIRSNYLGELILTSCYLKNQNRIQVRIQQINHLYIEQAKTEIPLEGIL